jgi:hypothetical protein
MTHSIRGFSSLIALLIIAVLVVVGFAYFSTRTENMGPATTNDSRECDKVEWLQFVAGQKYGEFTFDRTETIDECNARHYFTGTATVSGSYQRDDIDGTPYFVIDTKDTAKLPRMMAVNGNPVLWRSADLERLFQYTADERYGEAGKATLTISNPSLGETRYATDAGQEDSFAVTAVVSKEVTSSGRSTP